MVEYPGYPGHEGNPDGEVEDTADTDVDDSADTDDTLIDSDPEDSDPQDSDPEPPCEEAWWPGADLDGDGTLDLTWRVRIPVSRSTLERAPGAVDIDVAAWLEDAGVADPFDPGSLRLVVQDCGDMPQLPAQFVDSLGALAEREDHTRPTGDGAGSLMFTWELDDDLQTAESMDSDVVLGLYFSAGTSVAAPVPASDLVVTTQGDVTTMAAARTTMSVDAARGGLISALSIDGIDSFVSQTGSCCGNAMGFWSAATFTGAPYGWVTPQSAPTTVEVLATGPVVSAVRASGSLSAIVPDSGVSYGAYDYEHWFWRFAGRPEVWHAVSQRATAPCTTEHEIDASFAFRPLQVRHTLAATDTPTWIADQSAAFGAVFLADRGFAIGLHHRPAFYARVANPVGSQVPEANIVENYFAIHGNERFAPGVPTPSTVPTGESIFDAVGMVFLPFDGDWTSAEPVMRGLQEGLVTGVPGALEAAP